MFEVVCHLVSLIFRASALPVVRNCAWSWTRLYTSMVPADEREDRRRQVLSDLHDEAEDCQSGYTPAERAVRILFRTLRGVPDDLAWSAPYSARTFAGKLTRWSAAVGGARAPEWLLKSLTTVGFVNVAFLVSGDYDGWSNVLLVNAAAPVVPAFFLLIDRPLVQRAMTVFGIVSAAVAIGASLWALFAFRLYDEPVLFRSLSQCALVFAPPLLFINAQSMMQRTGVFEDRTWPTWAVRTVIVALSLFLSGHVGLNAWVLLAAWAALGAALLLLISVMAGCLLAAVAACYAGTKACAAGLKVAATRMRNLT